MVFAGGPIYRGLAISGDREDGSKMNFAMKPNPSIELIPSGRPIPADCLNVKSGDELAAYKG